MEADKALRKLSVKFDRVEEVITRAMAWVDSLHLAYLAADDQVRRLLNQAIFKRVFIGPDGVVRVEYTDGIVDLVVEDGQESVEQVGDAADQIMAVGGRRGAPQRDTPWSEDQGVSPDIC